MTLATWSRAASTSSLLLIACAVPSVFVARTQRVGTPDRLSAAALGVARGMALDEVKRRLGAEGASNIVEATMFDGETKADAVTADLLEEVLLFRGGLFHRALPIGCDRGTNIHTYLHLTRSEGTIAVIVVGPQMRHHGTPSVIVLLDHQRPAKRYIISYDFFPEWFKGVADPKMVGDRLDQGVTFVARSSEGIPWNNAVLLACDGKKANVTPISMARALDCGCIHAWYTKSSSRLLQKHSAQAKTLLEADSERKVRP